MTCPGLVENQRRERYMEDLYIKEDFDEVALWYQYLRTFDHAQDLALATFQKPEALVKTPEEFVKGKHPDLPTRHELQFLVANLAADTPRWKKQMAALHEQVVRNYGGVVPTKIMNEGWATFLQEFMTPHLPWTSDHHLVEYAKLRSAVAYPQLSNPYWLGREAWRRVYQRFRSEQGLDRMAVSFDADKAFVAHAQELIEQHDDFTLRCKRWRSLDWPHRGACALCSQPGVDARGKFDNH